MAPKTPETPTSKATLSDVDRRLPLKFLTFVVFVTATVAGGAYFLGSTKADRSEFFKMIEHINELKTVISDLRVDLEAQKVSRDDIEKLYKLLLSNNDSLAVLNLKYESNISEIKTRVGYILAVASEADEEIAEGRLMEEVSS